MCSGTSAPNLREIEAVLNGGSCAMTWRKKLSDQLSVRSYATVGSLAASSCFHSDALVLCADRLFTERMPPASVRSVPFAVKHRMFTSPQAAKQPSPTDLESTSRLVGYQPQDDVKRMTI
jgi:hypothetical protein